MEPRELLAWNRAGLSQSVQPISPWSDYFEVQLRLGLFEKENRVLALQPHTAPASLLGSILTLRAPPCVCRVEQEGEESPGLPEGRGRVRVGLEGSRGPEPVSVFHVLHFGGNDLERMAR